MSEKMLMVIHHRNSRTGRIGAKLAALGYELEACCPMEGDRLPENLDGYAGAVVFGGPMSANDDATLTGIRAELEWIPRALDHELPFLGVCLGAQLLARALGARVARHPEDFAEIGYCELLPANEGCALFARSMMVYHWHKEGFELPHGATLLARGKTFPNQAYRYGARAFGIQFHPEVTLEMMRDWLRTPGASMELPGAQPPDEHLEGHARFDAPLAGWLDRFLERWLSDEMPQSYAMGTTT